MKIEDLKQKATTSEMALIDTVERLVRSEYDEEKIRTEIHKTLRNEMEEAVLDVIRVYQHLDSEKYSHSYPTPADYRLKDICLSIGKAIRLEKEDSDEIH